MGRLNWLVVRHNVVVGSKTHLSPSSSPASSPSSSAYYPQTNNRKHVYIQTQAHIHEGKMTQLDPIVISGRSHFVQPLQLSLSFPLQTTSKPECARVCNPPTLTNTAQTDSLTKTLFQLMGYLDGSTTQSLIHSFSFGHFVYYTRPAARSLDRQFG